jgi:hypothetical protein
MGPKHVGVVYIKHKIIVQLVSDEISYVISYSFSVLNMRLYCAKDGGGGDDVRNTGTSPMHKFY